MGGVYSDRAKGINFKDCNFLFAARKNSCNEIDLPPSNT